MSLYRLAPVPGGTALVRAADNATIPADPGNRDYQDFLAWQAAGNAPDPAPTVAKSAVIAAYDYFQRFSAAETVAIHTASLTFPPTPLSLALYNYLLLASARGQVDLADPTVQGGHAQLVQAGLLTAQRSAEILTP